MKGRHTKKDGHATQQALTPAAETALVDHIRRCACSGFPLTPALIWEYANTITRGIPGRSEPVDVGEHWLQGFLLRHPSIRSHWSRCLDNARLTGATQDVIQQWFDCLAEIMREYSVASTNVFNMDETEFMFGLGGSERVIVPTGDPTTRFRAQPGARESATVTKCIGSGGQVLPPLIITKGKRHTVGEQRRMNGIPASWHFSKLDSGWTNSEIAVQWLETIFEPNTKLSTPSEWCLLIIDGHRSHTSQAFCDVLWSHRIIPYLLPPQSTHVMQPLDVSIFGPLTLLPCHLHDTYRHLVNQAAEHVDSIDKAQFGTLYAQARSKVLTQSAARKAFSDSGITLNSSPEKVLRRIASASTVAEASGTSQRQPLQEIAIPRSDSAFNAVLDATLSAHAQEPNSREARTLKRMIQQTNEATYVSIAVPEAENKMLRAQQERKSKTSATVGKMVAKGDQRVLSKDVMITQEFAERERELVAKGPPNSRTERGDHRQEEEDEVASPTAAVPDGDNESDDGDDNILMQSNTPSASHAYILG